MEKTGLSLAKIRAFFALLVVGLLIVFLERSGALDQVKGMVQAVSNPVQIGFYRSYQNFTSFAMGLAEIGNLRSKGAKLEVENATLQAGLAKLKILEAENQTLKAQLGIASPKLKMIAFADVIGLGTGVISNDLTLNKGSLAGVKKGDLVVVENIFLGQIAEVNPRSARVELLTDSATKIAAVTESGALGLAVGQFGTEATLTNVVQDDQLKVGELVLTAGDENLPKGLVLGKISSVKKVSRELFQQASLKPLLNLAKLTSVFIMRTP